MGKNSSSTNGKAAPTTGAADDAKPTEKGEAEAKDSYKYWVAIAASTVSGIAFVLGMLGYGVALSVEVLFGIPHAVVYESFSDLIDLSSIAVVQLLNHISSLGKWDLIWDIYKQNLPFIGVMTLVWVGFTAFVWWWHKPATKTWRDARQAKKAARVKAKGAEADRWKELAWLTLIFPALPLFSLLVIFSVVAMTVAISVAPLLGMVAGQSNIMEWVVEPNRCVPVRNRAERLKPPAPAASANDKSTRAVTCVAVAGDDDSPPHTGRVVLATSKVVLLFDPGTGDTIRLPLSGASMRMIDKLAAPPAASAPR